jgi:lysozyme family protein
MEVFQHNNLFDKLVNIVLANEGWDQFTNRINDKGGATKYGISDRRDGVKDGMADLNHDGKGDVKIQDLTINQAKQIYKADYYNPLCPQYLKSDELILNLFDFGVTSGPGTAIKLLQELLGVENDGALGPVTADKVNKYPGNLIGVYKEARRNFYRNIVKNDATQAENLTGWINRVNHLKLK